MQRLLKIGAAKLVRMRSFKKTSTPEAYENGATATWTLKSADESVQLGTGNLTFVAASSGWYEGTIPAAVTGALIDGTFYVLIVVFSVGGVQVDRRRIVYEAAHREES